jgi:hypothetical protein
MKIKEANFLFDNSASQLRSVEAAAHNAIAWLRLEPG